MVVEGSECVLAIEGGSSAEWDLIEVSNPSVLGEILSGRATVTLRRSVQQTTSQEGGVVHLGNCRTYAKQPDPVLVAPSFTELYTLEKVSATEMAIQMLLPICSRAAGIGGEDVAPAADPETMSDGTSSSACVVSEIVTFRTLRPACSDLFALHYWLCQQTKTRAHVWTLPGNESFCGVTVEELMNAPVAVSTKDALNDFFETFPVLVVPPQRSTGPIPVPAAPDGSAAEGIRLPWQSYELIPLDQTHDLSNLCEIYTNNLRQHLREFGESERETLQEFSFFTALYVLGRTCTEMELGFSALQVDGANMGAVQDYTTTVMKRPVCAYQFMRYFSTAVKNGFEFVVAPNPENSSHFLDCIGGLETKTHDMSVCQKVGVRMTVSLAKMALLRGVPRLIELSRPLHPDTLVRYHYGYDDTGTRLTLASLIEVEPAVELTICEAPVMIQAFESLLREIFPQGPQGANKYGQLQDAIYAERDYHASGRATDSWVPWNWRIAPVNETTRIMLMGKVSGKRMLSNAYESLKEMGMEKNDCWLPMLLAGRAFVCGLPEDILDHLDADGVLTVHPKSLTGPIKAFVIGCDARRIRWQWKSRLTTLYKLCPYWPREILFEYLCPTLKFDGAPTFEEIVSTYLKPCTDSSLLTNIALCLEHITQR